jgi:hypothetical protein
MVGLLVSGQVTMRVPRYLKKGRTSQRMPNQRAAAKTAMAIKPIAVSMFKPPSSTSSVLGFGSLLLDLLILARSHSLLLARAWRLTVPTSAKNMPVDWRIFAGIYELARPV